MKLGLSHVVKITFFDTATSYFTPYWACAHFQGNQNSVHASCWCCPQISHDDVRNVIHSLS